MCDYWSNWLHIHCAGHARQLALKNTCFMFGMLWDTSCKATEQTHLPYGCHKTLTHATLSNTVTEKHTEITTWQHNVAQANQGELCLLSCCPHQRNLQCNGVICLSNLDEMITTQHRMSLYMCNTIGHALWGWLCRCHNEVSSNKLWLEFMHIVAEIHADSCRDLYRQHSDSSKQVHRHAE